MARSRRQMFTRPRAVRDTQVAEGEDTGGVTSGETVTLGAGSKSESTSASKPSSSQTTQAQPSS